MFEFKNSNKTKIHFKPYIFNRRDTMFNTKSPKSSKWLTLILGSFRRLLIIIFRYWEILVYFLSCDPGN